MFSSKNNNSKTKVPKALALSFIGAFTLVLSANAQSSSTPGVSLGNVIYGAPGTTTLRDPLVPGSNYSLPGVAATPGAAPPLGAGLVPVPPNPGMIFLPPTFIPWANGTAGNSFSQSTSQVVIPANQIDQSSNQLSLPVNNATAMPPGGINRAVGGVIPHAPSVPGADPGILRPPSFYNGSSAASPGLNQNSAAAIGAVGSDGRLPDGLAPIKRPVRQGSNDFGLKRKTNGYRAQITTTNGQTVFGGWIPQTGSATTDFGLGSRELGVKQQEANALAAATGSVAPQLIGRKAQISFDAPRPAQYPGQENADSTSGNHTQNLPKAQVTNDLNGIPMINPNKIYTSSSGVVSRGTVQQLQPLTTIIPPPAP